MTVRQVVSDFPSSQTVFENYGEARVRPGLFGHLEPLTHFARRLNLPLDQLLQQLADATGAPLDVRTRFAERVHHPFLCSALFVTLSIGAGWGAWLLWRIGADVRFDSVPAAHIVAHGEAQLWGFIVLFIMGISLRTVLQGIARHRLGPWYCHSLLMLGLLGVIGSFLWFVMPSEWPTLGIASAGALCLMAAGYSMLQFVMLRRKWPATWARAVLVSGLWLVAWGVIIICLRLSAGAAGPGAYSSSQRLLLIQLAVFGFAMNSIYGFGQMLLPGILRIGSTSVWAIEAGHWVHNIGAAVVMLATGLRWHVDVAATGCGLVAAGAVLFAIGNRAFIGRRRSSQREEQGHAALDYYVPLAFFWLIASLLLMAGGLIYQSTSGALLPHAYMGAVRHALTVGFMTTLILGVGQRMLPVLDRTVLVMPKLVVPILALIGLGNFLRVGSELAILYTAAAFRLMPPSAVLEWCALALFALSAVTTMYHVDPLLRREQVSERSSLAVLLGEHPWIEDRLLLGGTGYLMRTRSVPHELTIGSYAKSEGYEVGRFVQQINDWLADAKTKCRRQLQNTTHAQSKVSDSRA
jgi:hypothetical protein